MPPCLEATENATSASKTALFFQKCVLVLLVTIAGLGCEGKSERFPRSSNMEKSIDALSGALTTRPFTVSTLQPLTPEEVGRKNVLNGQEQARIEASFQHLGVGHALVNPPVRSEKVRWSDLPLAVQYAADDAEMVVAQTIEHDWGMEYHLRTIEDFPATLLVRRTADDHIYTASATVGLWEDHSDRAAELLNALDVQMKAFAGKRAIPRN